MNRIADTARIFLLAILAISHVQCQDMSNLRTKINPDAATVARTELLIHAPPKAIWSVLTDLRNEESIDEWKLAGSVDGNAFLTESLNIWKGSFE